MDITAVAFRIMVYRGDCIMNKKIAAAAAGAGTAGAMLLVRKTFHRIFRRVDKPEASVSLGFDDLPEIDVHRVKIVSGSRHLTGYLCGEKSEKGLVVFCHGMNSGGEDCLFLATHLLENGYQVFLFDYTGVHESEGKSSVGFYQAVRDLEAVLDYIGNRRKESGDSGRVPLFLYGFSWGAYTVSAVLNHRKDIAGVVSVAGFRSPMAIIKEVSRKKYGIASWAVCPAIRLYQRLLFGKEYNLSAVDGINQSGIPVLIMHGVEDEVVKYGGASIIAARNKIKNPKVRYYVEDRPGKSGHMSILFTREGGDYHKEKQEELEMLEDLYCSRIPVNVMESWKNRLDKDKANEVDPQFIGQILEFLEEQIPSGQVGE